MSDNRKQELINMFEQSLGAMNAEELDRLSLHFDSILGAIYRFIANAYKAEMHNWIESASGQLMDFDDGEGFARDHAETLWESLYFRLTPQEASEAVADELSYWDD